MTTANLGSFLNFAQLACMAKFKIEPKCAAVKVTPLSEVALLNEDFRFSQYLVIILTLNVSSRQLLMYKFLSHALKKKS